MPNFTNRPQAASGANEHQRLISSFLKRLHHPGRPGTAVPVVIGCIMRG